MAGPTDPLDVLRACSDASIKFGMAQRGILVISSCTYPATRTVPGLEEGDDEAFGAQYLSTSHARHPGSYDADMRFPGRR